HLEVRLGDAAVGTSPSLRHVFPARTGSNAVGWPALGFVVDEATDHAHEGAVGRSDGGGGSHGARKLSEYAGRAFYLTGRRAGSTAQSPRPSAKMRSLNAL